MKKIFLFVSLLCLFAQTGRTQNPKWAEKAERAVFSVITYDKDDKILSNGNGFFISEDGVALSDYTTFKGAQRAVVVGSDGKEMNVTTIMGVNDIYDVIKFRVAVSKKVNTLQIAPDALGVGADVYLIPYSTQKNRSCAAGKVTQLTKIETKYNFYTLSLPLQDKMVSCPITNVNGQVIALAQKSVDANAATLCYGLDVAYANSLSISAFGTNSTDLKGIGIKKDLPEKEDQALVYLYMGSSQLSQDEYTELLNDFVNKFPDSQDGYIHRATNYVSTDKDGANIKLADQDLSTAIKVAKNRDDAYYNSAKLIYDYLLLKHENVYKDWNLDRALSDVRNAISINSLPVYIKLEGDILYAKNDYASALISYDKVNHSNIVSAATYFSSAKTMQMLNRDSKDVLAMMDSCIARCTDPITRDMAPYLLARAQMRMDAKMYRPALLDYNSYYNSMNGDVNDVFYYYREQAALESRQYQTAIDDIQKAIDINPKDMLYRVEQGALNLRVGRVDTAVEQLQKAIAVDPKYPETYRILGICQIQQKKNSEACANFNKAKELGDPSAQAMIEKYCK
jgi:tetratricopeptide (TPR) repeat protein